MNLATNLTELLNPAVTRAGFILEDVTVTPVGKRRLVSVVVDRKSTRLNSSHLILRKVWMAPQMIL